MSLTIFTWLILIHWPISVWAKKPAVVEAEIVTSFLTEAQLNAWFVKILGVIAIPVALQVFNMWKDSKANVSKRLDALDQQYVELIRIVSRLEGKFDERKR